MEILKIDKENIDPQNRLSEEEKEKKQEFREREDLLYSYIRKWWRGDLHTHSKESTREGYGYVEGIYDMEEIMNYYKKLDLEFVGFSEHASKPGEPIRQEVDGEISQSLLKEAEHIGSINRERGVDIAALSSVETNIMFDETSKPTLDIPDGVLEKLDVVIASRHAIADEKEPVKIKESLLAAINNKNVDVIGHPDRYTRRDHEKSSEYWQEYWNIWPEILEKMKTNSVAFEINLNSQPSRKLVQMAAEAEVKFFINYDAHDFNQYKKEKDDLIEAGERAKRHWVKQPELAKEDKEILKKYKQERLSAGPGYRAIVSLVRWIKRLESWGVTPDRVVNSSKDSLFDFLIKERSNRTENLDYLVKASKTA